jgi:hypothetical protein
MNNINGIGLIGESDENNKKSSLTESNVNNIIDSSTNIASSIANSVNTANTAKYNYKAAQEQATATKQASSDAVKTAQLNAETAASNNETLRYQADAEVQKAQIEANAKIEAARLAAQSNSNTTSDSGNTKTYLIIGGVGLVVVAGIATIVALTRK